MSNSTLRKELLVPSKQSINSPNVSTDRGQAEAKGNVLQVLAEQNKDQHRIDEPRLTLDQLSSLRGVASIPSTSLR